MLQKHEDAYGAGFRYVWVRDGGLTEARPLAVEMRPDELRLAIALVPTPLRWRSLAKVMPRHAWKRLSTQVKTQHGNRCAICGAERRLECHEVWHYDDLQHIQSLVGFQALCPTCHLITNFLIVDTLAEEGKLDREKVVEHFMRVNGCGRDTFERHWVEAFARYNHRSVWGLWTTDYGDYSHYAPGQVGELPERPSTYIGDAWLCAHRMHGTYPEETDRCGKWMIQASVDLVDTWWASLKDVTEKGRLGSRVAVETAFPDPLAIGKISRFMTLAHMMGDT